MSPHPNLSLFDPIEGSTDSLDPLGLYQIADSLALKLIPAVRERMRHPRFLTVIAAGAAACRDIPEGMEPSDGISPAWLAFEWHYVEALTRRLDERPITGMPGLNKVKIALAKKQPVCAKTYLKTPSVFGFHGVYRLLSEKLDFVVDDIIGANGDELLETWEREQKLAGFYRNEDGPGKVLKKKVRDAVIFGLQNGHTKLNDDISGFFFNNLHFSDPGPKEADLLLRILRSQQDHGFRSEVLDFLMSKETAKLLKTESTEQEFHEALYNKASEGCKTLLMAIKHYEAFSRLLQDAFEEMISVAGERTGQARIADCAKGEKIKAGAAQAFDMYKTAIEKLEPIGEDVRFDQLFGKFNSTLSAADWAQLLLDHHSWIQSEKPPDGKASWLVKTKDNRIMPMSSSFLNRIGKTGTDYVHTYRTGALLSFLKDLRKV